MVMVRGGTEHYKRNFVNWGNVWHPVPYTLRSASTILAASIGTA
jgi:hypothetical protein